MSFPVENPQTPVKEKYQTEELLQTTKEQTQIKNIMHNEEMHGKN